MIYVLFMNQQAEIESGATPVVSYIEGTVH